MPNFSSVADPAEAHVTMVKILSIFMVIFYLVIKPRLAPAVVFQGVQEEPKSSLGLIQGLPGGWDARSSQKVNRLVSNALLLLSVCLFLIRKILNTDKLRILL